VRKCCFKELEIKVEPYVVHNLLLFDKKKSLLQKYHEIYRHTSEQYLRKMSRLGMVKGLSDFRKDPTLPPCSTCIEVKSKTRPISKNWKKEEDVKEEDIVEPGDIVMSDMDQFSKPVRGGYFCIARYIDVAT
jgi:hypothetical protein